MHANVDIVDKTIDDASELKYNTLTIGVMTKKICHIEGYNLSQ